MPSQRALDGINLEIHKGEVVLLSGANGAGKSTLLKLVYREEEPSSGEILVEGRNLKSFDGPAVARLRRRVGLVFQEFRLLANLTALENIALAAEIAGTTKKAAQARAEQLLGELGLASRRHDKPSGLSGGEQQRVAVARALVNRPALILADEPTGNLDGAAAAETLRLFEEIRKQDSTIVIASHDVNLFRAIASRVIHLERGRIVADTAGSGAAEWRL
ncbi:MAG: ATP-binding cassette domain-containing protein [Candidatus Binatota bacterium]|nr:ATP-binding cassette domain-containing protein [Candidatus Binatota bacterium]